MKVVLAGAFGNLGAEILKCLVADGHEIVAADLKELPVAGCEGRYTFVPIDATRPETLKGLCDGAAVVITTMGLTGASTRVTSYDIDHRGKMNPIVQISYIFLLNSIILTIIKVHILDYEFYHNQQKKTRQKAKK